MAFRKLIITKPKRPVGERIGPVRITERRSLLPDNFFAIRQVSTGKVIAGLWSPDDAIGYCHERLIPIESFERLMEDGQ